MYKITEGLTGVYEVEVYNGSNVGWTWVKDFKTKVAAERWILKRVILRTKSFRDGSFKGPRHS